MKILSSLALCLLFVSSTMLMADHHKEAKGNLRHVVMFQFKASSSEAEIKTVVEAFRALPSKIDSIIDYEAGVNNSPEGHDNGFTHVFLVTFKDEAGREKYLPHPAHKAFVTILKPHLEKVMVLDYFSK